MNINDNFLLSSTPSLSPLINIYFLNVRQAEDNLTGVDPTKLADEILKTHDTDKVKVSLDSENKDL